MKKLSHMDKEGRVAMVDTSAKLQTARRAVASAMVLMSPATVEAVREHRTPKGDPLETARLAGIMAAKRTAELIPLCHTLPLNGIDVDIDVDAEAGTVIVTATARVYARTGVEMEAMVGCAAGALCVYDMVKGIERGVVIERVELLEKSGGRSGTWRRDEQQD